MTVPYILYPTTFKYDSDKDSYLAVTDAAFGEPDGNETYWGVSYLEYVKDKEVNWLVDETMKLLNKCILDKFGDTELRNIT